MFTFLKVCSSIPALMYFSSFEAFEVLANERMRLLEEKVELTEKENSELVIKVAQTETRDQCYKTFYGLRDVFL